MNSQSRVNLRFGPFEIDRVAMELRKHGLRVRLQKQPFQILSALLERPHEVVTRAELHRTVWADDTFVDFEHGLNAAINKLRQALADSPENPNYIETIPGVGYRWLAPIEPIQPPTSIRPSVATDASQTSPGMRPAAATGAIKWAAVGLLLVVGVIAGWLLRTVFERIPPASLAQFTIEPPDGFFFEPALTRQDFAMSPDGERLAFVASNASQSQLWMREIRSLRSYQLAPDRNVRGVVWSPDSRFVYFDERTTVRRVSTDGGAAQTICQLPPGPPWMGLLQLGESLVLYTRAGSFQIPNSSGTARRLDNAPYRWVQALPGGHILQVEYDREINRYRAVATTVTGDGSRQVLMETDSRVLYSPPAAGERIGHLLFVRAGSLIAQSFDGRAVRLAGEPVPVASNVFSFSPTGSASFSVSDNGVLVYRTAQSPLQLKWFERTGREAGTVAEPATFFGQFRLSPDGGRLAAPVYDVEKGGIDVWLYDLIKGSRRKITSAPGVSNPGIWSPDGDRIVFARAQGETPKLYWTSTGENPREDALPPAYFQIPTDWSRDGRFIAYQTGGGVGEPESGLFLLDLANQRRIVPLLNSGPRFLGAVFHPDTTSIAFLSDETGRAEMFVQSFESGGEPRLVGSRNQISHDGASVIRWRSDGKELFYLNSENWLVSVPASPHGLAFGTPQRLFHVETPPRNLSGGGPDWGFDVSGDGSRFLLIDGRGSRSAPLVLMQNWQRVLHR